MASKVLNAAGDVLGPVPIGYGKFHLAIIGGFTGTITVKRKLFGESNFNVVADYTAQQELVGDCGEDDTEFLVEATALSSGTPRVYLGQRRWTNR